MELRLPTLLRGVAKELNVRQASARLHLAPLSRQIHDLEDEVGTKPGWNSLTSFCRGRSRRRLQALTEKQWLNFNKGTKCEIGIKKSRRRPFSELSIQTPTIHPEGYYPIESDPCSAA
jgi:hypothetical protein